MTLNSARGGMFGRARPAVAAAWTRPFDWKQFPVRSEPEVVQLLYMVTKGPNYAAMKCEGAFSVDWGDGAGFQNYTSGATAEKKLAWDDYDDYLIDGQKQAIVTVVPQGGASLTTFNMNVRHSEATSTVGDLLLEAKVVGPSLTTLSFRGDSQTRHGLLQSVQISGSNQVASAESMFRGTGLVTTGNISLPSATSVSYMFSGCTSLRDIGVLNLPSVTDCYNMFNGCTALISTGNIGLPSARDCRSLFSGCTSLQTIGTLNFPAVDRAEGLFSNCRSLLSAGDLSFPTASSTNSMFDGCTALTSVGNISANATTNCDRMFAGCNALREAGVLNMSTFSGATSMFTGATQLRKLVFHADGVHTLPTIPSTILERLVLPGYREGNVDVSGKNMNATALNEMFTSLGTPATTYTVTVTGNPGADTCDTTIAENKGWTVVTSA